MTGDLGDTPVAGSPATTLPAFLALGDSYSIGEGVEAGGRWPVQLARALRLEGRDLGEPRIVATTGWTPTNWTRASTRRRRNRPSRASTCW